ncbi:hypothetical protein HHI36_023007 [Cryptolaemus montrouzieri]|uniref:PCNA-associated factor histone-like domain-containing protein n=1 Tax=Cryptolaemus montrouzieri TaxID=559131 RepID=A0ABD2PF19_9CUCU
MVRSGDRVIVSGGRSSAKKGGCSSNNSTPSTSRGAASSSKQNSSIGGNPVCPRETPAWQKPITSFFHKRPSIKAKPEEEEKIQSNEILCPIVEIIEDDNNLEKVVQGSIKKLEQVTEKKAGTSDEPESVSNDDPTTPIKKIKLDKDDAKENESSMAGSSSSCKTPTSDKKRKSNYINILTPRRKKNQY